jgi:uncharacterized protein YbjT (DUF2867 family)
VRILLTGATGFIGTRLASALRARGHEVVCASRSGGELRADFTTDLDAETWVPRLEGIDAVVNAVGILRERGRQTFEALHVRGPQALFSACVLAGVGRVVQISALGADEHAHSAYHLSKRRADEYLCGLPLDSTIVQPSLVYGAGGASATLLTGLASLPWIPVPGRGDAQVQPVHVDDAVEGIVTLLPEKTATCLRIPFVGPEPLALGTLLAQLRAGMRLPRARFIHVPLSWMRAAAALGRVLPSSLLDADSLSMLLRGNTGDSRPLAELLGRPARHPRQFISAHEVTGARMAAQLQWLSPMLRWSIALVWIVTGIVSLGAYPAASSYALLARVGIVGSLASLALYGGAALDLLFGFATLVLRRRRVLWLAQIATIALYTLIITWTMPEFWLHPFGPLLKNVPMLAAIWLLYRLEPR